MIGAPLPSAEYDDALRRVLRRHRKRIGVTKSQLALATGISEKQIQRYEAGTNKVSVSRLMQLAQAMGMPASELLAEIEFVPAKSNTPADLGFLKYSVAGRELIAALRNLQQSRHLGLLAELAIALAEKRSDAGEL